MASPTLGSAIRARRHALRLTQAELAARLGGDVPQFEISRLERDHFHLHGLRRLAQVAEALGLTLSELLEMAGWSNAARAIGTPELAPAPPAPVVIMVASEPGPGATDVSP